PTFRVPVRLVTIPALVFSKDNRLINGLHASDFRVFDGGKEQSVISDERTAPFSIALAIQTNADVREYLPAIAKSGSVVDALLAGETGEVAVLTYAREVMLAKPFDSGDVTFALKKLSADGRPARMIDAGLRAVALLAQRPDTRTRILVFIGQAMDNGSESDLKSLAEAAERQNVAIYCISLPEFGKAFVSDTFSLQGAPKGGFTAGVDLGKLISALNRSAKAEGKTDPFSVLTAATGGTEIHSRTPRQLEDALGAIGVELRSAYVLSYSANSLAPGYHAVQVGVTVEGAKVYARPGYWQTSD
ncbi:MAG: VWA domain-containing protein, partial [Acidobacteriia bacterium]|nr:VWA domain-containing protein [Terriglobia bacterium]